jgi:hypothetical protein
LRLRCSRYIGRRLKVEIEHGIKLRDQRFLEKGEGRAVID